MNTLLDKNGQPIEYTRDDYDQLSQTNVSPAEGGNFFNINAATKEKQVGRVESDGPALTISSADLTRADKKGGYYDSYEQLVQNRINNQSDFARAGLALGMGVVGAVGTAMKDIGYMTSPKAWGNYVGWHDAENYSFTTKWLVDSGNFLEEGAENWAPIYEKEADTITDQILRWNTMKGIVDSSIGFLIPGMVAEKLVAGIGASAINGGGKLVNWLNKLETLNTTEKAALRLGRALKATEVLAKTNPGLSRMSHVLGATYVQGVGEATWEAQDIHDDIMKDFAFGINSGRVNPIEALAVADRAAQKTYQMNMVKSALNLHIMNQFVPKGVNKVAKVPNPWVQELDAVLEMPFEGLEESSQNVFKKEAEYEATKEYEKLHANSAILQELKKTGRYNDDMPSKLVDRILQFSKSSDVIVDGIVGMISGPVQSKLGNVMRGHVMPGSAFKAAKADYVKYKADEKATRESVTNDSELIKAQVNTIKSGVNKAASGKPAAGNNLESKNLQSEVEKAALAKELHILTESHPELAQVAKEQVFSSIITESIAKGTFEALLEEAKKLQGTSAFSNDLYEFAKKVDKKYAKTTGFLNRAQVINKINSVEAQERIMNHYIADKSILDSLDSPSSLELQRSEDLGKSISLFKESIKNTKDEINALSSISHQMKLHKEQQIKDETLEMQKLLSKVDSKKRLLTLMDLYPGIEKTKEFIEAKARINSTSTEPNVVQDKAKPAAKPTVSTAPSAEVLPKVEENQSGVSAAGENNAGAKGSPVTNVLPLEDSHIQSRLTAIIPDITETESSEARVKLRAFSDKLLASSPPQAGYEAAMAKTIDLYAQGIQNLRAKNTVEGKEEQQEVNEAIKETTTGQATAKRFKKILSIIQKQKKLQASLES